MRLKINRQRLEFLLEFLIILCGALVFTAITAGIIAVGIEYPIFVISGLIVLAISFMVFYIWEINDDK